MNFVDCTEHPAGRDADDTEGGELGRCGGGKRRLWLPPCETTTNTLFTLLHHLILVLVVPSDSRLLTVLAIFGALP